MAVLLASSSLMAAGTSAARPVGALAAASTTAVRLAGDGFGFCAVLSRGRARCWGSNYRGALGDGCNEDYSTVPVTVRRLSGATSLVTDGTGWCALLGSGDVDCWGDNSDGALGTGSAKAFSRVPVPVKGLSRAASLTFGGDAVDS